MSQQRIVVVTSRPGERRGADELNVLLQRGWRVVTISPMGGGCTSHFASLVVIEREGPREEVMWQEIEEVASLPEGDPFLTPDLGEGSLGDGDGPLGIDEPGT